MQQTWPLSQVHENQWIGLTGECCGTDPVSETFCSLVLKYRTLDEDQKPSNSEP
jgi:hypothetical protein